MSKSSGSEMPIFDRYIAVDWSANNGPKTGKDSIWIGEATPAGLVASRNPATRALAMSDLAQTLLSARSRGERVMVGFDFIFGFPKGAAADIVQAPPPSPSLPARGRVSERSEHDVSTTSPLAGEASEARPSGRSETRRGGAAGWMDVWSTLFDLIQDTDQNLSNRFDIAEHINRATAPRFWGHPHGRTYTHLQPTRAATDYTTIAERRAVETRITGPQPVWKLYGNGSVGSQTLLGIPRLEALRRHPILGPDIAVWPFETDFERNLSAPIVLVEIYPSFFEPSLDVLPVDRAQVETCVRRYSALDAVGLLEAFLAAPSDLTPADRAIAIAEEGWIAGVGHEHLKAKSVRIVTVRPPSPPPALRSPPIPANATYLRDPDAIYDKSFATIRAETDLSAFPPDIQDVVVRMIHACGMTDIVSDVRWSGDLISEAGFGLNDTAPVFCDCEAVRSGIIRRHLFAHTDVDVTLNDPAVPELSKRLGTTRSAAAVDLWRPYLHDSVVVIGNAPTALFRLLELLADGADRPAAIIATPVGFVGAAESKALLVENSYGVPFITVLGRRGGSAMASAAFNAMMRKINPVSTRQ